MTDDRERRLREAGLDKTIKTSFPASDPPSTDPDPIDRDAASGATPRAGGVEPPSAGDPHPPHCELIEVRVGELKQIFNGIDPSPFREKDLDPAADEFIVGWAREARRDVALALQVHVGRPPGLPDEPAMLGEAVREYFRGRAQATRSRLRLLLRVGRLSLLIGVVCLALSVGLGGMVERLLAGQRLGEILRESLLIGGWVAMWRPLETFLYDWWPIRTEARLFDRLSVMPVRIAYTSDANADAWRRDWPAVPPGREMPKPARANGGD